MSAEEKPTLSVDGISDAMGKLLEHPELLANVASVLGVSMPKTLQKSENSTEQNDTPDNADTENAQGEVETEVLGIAPDVMSTVMPLLSKLSGKGGSCRHEQLLCALKPYLSPSRCEAIDYILKISRMSDLVKGIRG